MSDQLQAMTTEIVSGFVAANTVPPEALPALIKSVYAALLMLSQPEPEPEAPAAAKVTAAQIRKSITDDGLISFVDGRRYKTLKRHLTTHGLTVAEYRTRYGLPNDYPTTSPNYSAARSAMAKEIGLGRKVGQTRQVMAAAKKPAGRPKKSAVAKPEA